MRLGLRGSLDLFVNFSTSKMSDLAKVLHGLYKWHLYSTGITAVELLRYLWNINMIFNCYHVFWQCWKIPEWGEICLVPPTPELHLTWLPCRWVELSDYYRSGGLSEHNILQDRANFEDCPNFKHWLSYIFIPRLISTLWATLCLYLTS